MIKTEFFGIIDGKRLIRTYSDSGFRIVQDGTGAVYDDAVDPEDMNRTYTESDERISVEGIDTDTAEKALRSGLFTMNPGEPVNEDYFAEQEEEPDYFEEG